MTAPHDRSGWLARFLFGSATPPSPFLDVLLLLSRLYAGLAIAGAGLDKLPTPSWMVDQVGQIGLPMTEVSAHAACLTEFVAGLLLAAGLMTRPAALAVATVMGVASFGYHRLTPILDMHIAQGLFWLFIVFVAIGGGTLSLDALMRRMRRRPGARATVVAMIAAVPLALGLYYDFLWSPPAATAPTTDIEFESVAIAGSFNDWSLTDDLMSPVADRPGVWRREITIDAPGVVELKFAGNASWDNDLGENDEQDVSLPREGTGEPRGGNIRIIVERPSTLAIELDTSTLAYLIEVVAADQE
ncbi:MAG: DoxX family membrane protein [Phycisphaerales bacterium]|nr:DoxX family membrane protein [Phycisphaerales bacterium]